MNHNQLVLQLSLQQHYFDAVKTGHKTVEGRLNSAKFKDCKPGMHIKFTAATTHEVILCRIEAIHRYANFYDMLQAHGVDNMLPGVVTIGQGVTLYESFSTYKEDVEKLGAIAITIKIITDY